MKKILLVYFFAISVAGFSQKLVLDQSSVSFYSHAAIEDIAAENKSVTALFNIKSFEVAFSIPITKFQFAKSLMQEHFNEKYMESDKYPKSTFQGKIEGYDHLKSELQYVKAVGKLTIHGVTNHVQLPGTIEKQEGRFRIRSKFTVILKDYNIDIPKLFFQNIAEQVEVTADFIFKPQ